MQNKIQYICTKDDENQRLDYVLAHLFPTLGLRARKRLCEQGFILVNAKVARAATKLRVGNSITFLDANNTYEAILQKNPEKKCQEERCQEEKSQDERFQKILEDTQSFFSKKKQSLASSYAYSHHTIKNYTLNDYILQESPEYAAIYKPAFVHSAHIKGKSLQEDISQGKDIIFLNNEDSQNTLDAMYVSHNEQSSKATQIFINFENSNFINITSLQDMQSLLPVLFPDKKTVLLNRLDFSTSGILMVAFINDSNTFSKKDISIEYNSMSDNIKRYNNLPLDTYNKSLQLIKNKWEVLQDDRNTQKFYLALVEGDFFENHNVSYPLPIQGQLILKKSQKVKVNTKINGDRVTKVTPISKIIYPAHGIHEIKMKNTDNVINPIDNSSDSCIFTLVLCEISKGARHQIRAHLASIGHPLVGDKKYGAKHLLSYEDLIYLVKSAHELPPRNSFRFLNRTTDKAISNTIKTARENNTSRTTDNKTPIIENCLAKFHNLYSHEQFALPYEVFFLHHIQISFSDFKAQAFPFFWKEWEKNLQEQILFLIS